jgi:hypothetical protein
MPPHKSEDYKITAVQYYLSKNNNQVKKIFKYHPRSLIIYLREFMSVQNNINQKITQEK